MTLIEFILAHDRLVSGVLVGLMFFVCAHGFLKGRATKGRQWRR